MDDELNADGDKKSELDLVEGAVLMVGNGMLTASVVFSGDTRKLLGVPEFVEEPNGAVKLPPGVAVK